MILGPNAPTGQPNDLSTQKAVEDPEDAKGEPADKKRWAEFRQRIDISKAYRKKLVRNWRINIDMRRGKTFAAEGDEDTIAVNLDWSFTKSKHAELFSQVPKVRVDHAPESVMAGPWVTAFERRLNDNLVIGGIEAAMEEVIPDCVNAAGIGIVLVAHESLMVNKDVPAIDISFLPQEMQDEALKTKKIFGEDLPMTSVPTPVDSRYTIRRISPADFLWPTDFTGSSFDNAPWIGYSGRIPWVEAMKRFNLKEEDKKKYIGEDQSLEDRMSDNYERDHGAWDDKVGYDELFYHEYQYNPDADSFSTIHHIVFLDNKVDPVLDEPWEGQQFDPQTKKIKGSSKNPLRILTLNYISDEDIPPSDSAVARAQVKEINRGRSIMAKQRARNFPTNWFDVNRLDPAIQNALMRGVLDHAVPVQGDGSRVLGSIVQPALPQENYLFDSTAKKDMQEIWNTGVNQTGGGEDVETAKEASVIQTNVTTKLARERAKVVSFVVGIAEVMGGLMCLTEDPAIFGEGFDPSIGEKLQYSILADSTVLVDVNQRLAKLKGYINDYATSGWVNLEPVLKEITTLVGLDPSTVIVPPKGKEPEQPNISLRLTGGEDMMNPLLLAFMINANLAPKSEQIDQAMKLIQQAVTMQPTIPPGTPGMAPEAPPSDPNQPGATPPLPGQPGSPQPPITPGTANPQMETLPQVNPNLKPTASGR